MNDCLSAVNLALRVAEVGRYAPDDTSGSGRSPFTRCDPCQIRAKCLCRPRIYNIDIAVFEIFRVACSEDCPSRTSHCGNHGVELADGLSRTSTRCSDLGVHLGGVAVET